MVLAKCMLGDNLQQLSLDSIRVHRNVPCFEYFPTVYLGKGSAAILGMLF